MVQICPNPCWNSLKRFPSVHCHSWYQHKFTLYELQNDMPLKPTSKCFACNILLYAIPNIFSVTFFPITYKIPSTHIFHCVIVLHNVIYIDFTNSKQPTHQLTELKTKKERTNEPREKSQHVSHEYRCCIHKSIESIAVMIWLTDSMNKRLWLITHRIWICRNKRHVFNFLHRTNL